MQEIEYSFHRLHTDAQGEQKQYLDGKTRRATRPAERLFEHNMHKVQTTFNVIFQSHVSTSPLPQKNYTLRRCLVHSSTLDKTPPQPSAILKTNSTARERSRDRDRGQGGRSTSAIPYLKHKIYSSSCLTTTGTIPYAVTTFILDSGIDTGIISNYYYALLWQIATTNTSARIIIQFTDGAEFLATQTVNLNIILHSVATNHTFIIVSVATTVSKALISFISIAAYSISSSTLLQPMP